MALTPAAVAVTEAFHRYWQVRKASSEITFIAAPKRPGSEHLSGFSQGVNVPVDYLATLHMTGKARLETAGSFGRAAVQIFARSKGGRQLSAHPDYKRFTKIDDE